MVVDWDVAGLSLQFIDHISNDPFVRIIILFWPGTLYSESDYPEQLHESYPDVFWLTNGVHLSYGEHMNSGVTETWQLYSRPILVKCVDGRIMDKIMRSWRISII